MKEKFIDFMSRLDSNWDIFFVGTVATIIGVVLFNITTRYIKNKRENAEGKIMKLEDLLLLFICIFMIFAGVLLLKSWNGTDITDGQVLTATVSFISPFIAFTGAYTIFNLGKNSDKLKEKEYAEDMLSNLLYVTLKETNGVVGKIYKSYKIQCIGEEKELNIKNDKYEESRAFTSGLLSLYDNENKSRLDALRKIIKEEKLNKLVYDSDWTKYLKHIEKNKRASIIKWLNLLKSDEINESLFLTSRELMITTIQLNPLNKYISDIDKVKNLNDIIEKNLNEFKKVKEYKEKNK